MKSNPFLGIVNYFSTSVSELRKVIWPTRREVINHTLIIVVTGLIGIVVLGLLDYGLTSLLRLAVVGQ